MRKHLKCVNLKLVALAILLLTVRSGFAEDSSAKTYQAVNDKRMAVTVADAYSGLTLSLGQPIDPNGSVETEIKTFEDSTTAFVSSQLNARRVYKVVFAPTRLPLADIRPEVVDDNPIQVEVILDSITGQLIQIDFLPALKERYEIPHISPSRSESQLARSGEEYLGLPETPPGTSLLETIETALFNEQYFCTFHMANRVSAKYLLWRQWDGEVTPVWVVECWGGFSIGQGESDHMRNIFDAETSKLLMAGNTPIIRRQSNDK